jgi:predicted RNase H-like nuclease (RuvC/YqgF family)
MNARTWRNRVAVVSLAVAALTFTALTSSATPQDSSQQSTADPVADAARKARDQKKKDTAKPKHVYTDEDVNHSTLGSAPSSTDKNAASTPNGGAAQNSDTQGKDAAGKAPEPEESPEVKWRKQFKEAYANLNRAEKELDILQRENNKAQVQYYSDPQKALAEQYTRKDINDHDAKIAAKNKEIDQLKQRISDMEEALRKSGGDPGWAAP